MKFAAASLLLSVCTLAQAQGTKADYDRANHIRETLTNKTVDVPGPVTWLPGGDRFYYRKSTKGGNAFVLVDAATAKKQAAFDHEKLAAALSAAEKAKYTASNLPLAQFDFTDTGKAITFAASGSMWKCTLADYACSKSGPAPDGGAAGHAVG